MDAVREAEVAMSRLCVELESSAPAQLRVSQLESLRSLCERLTVAINQHAHDDKGKNEVLNESSKPSRVANRLRQTQVTMSQSRLVERRHSCSRRPRAKSEDHFPDQAQAVSEDVEAAAEAFHSLFEQGCNSSCNHVWRRRSSGSGWSTTDGPQLVQKSCSDGGLQDLGSQHLANAEDQSSTNDDYSERDDVSATGGQPAGASKPSKFASRVTGEAVAASNSRLLRRRAASCDTIRFGQRRSAVVLDGIPQLN